MSLVRKSFCSKSKNPSRGFFDAIESRTTADKRALSEHEPKAKHELSTKAVLLEIAKFIGGILQCFESRTTADKRALSE